jgi:hypothetical protein
VENETRFSRKYQCESRESHESREKEKCNILCNLRNSQTSKIIIHSEKLVLDPKFSQGFRVKISNDSRESHYKICVAAKFVCETHESCYKIFLQDLREASLVAKFLYASLARSESSASLARISREFWG